MVSRLHFFRLKGAKFGIQLGHHRLRTGRTASRMPNMAFGRSLRCKATRHQGLREQEDPAEAESHSGVPGAAGSAEPAAPGAADCMPGADKALGSNAAEACTSR